MIFQEMTWQQFGNWIFHITLVSFVVGFGWYMAKALVRGDKP